MRILLIHAKRFQYKALEPATKEFEELTKLPGEGTFENVLVVFTTIEDGDDEEVVNECAREILKVSSQVKPTSILIYPYAHLSNKLAPPSYAIQVLEKLSNLLKNIANIPVNRAPFGWYKSFTLECYGHPLSELSRSIERAGVVSSSRRIVEKKYYIMTPEGELLDPLNFDYTDYPDLKILVDKEVFGKEFEGGENKVNEYCNKFNFEWEPMSDHGHMRYGPYATIMMDALFKYSWQVVQSLGIPIFRVMGSNMFNLKERPVYEHAMLFGDRLYELQLDNEKYILRYAACHQQFAMIRNWIISYKQLPFGVFEIADSYRLEQRGELSLCFRLRKFYMPDLHIITKDLNEAIHMSTIVQAKIHEEVSKIGRKYVALYNVSEDFLNNYRDALIKFVRNEKYPVLVSVIPSGIYYWVLNVEYHIIDNLKRPREIATFQIDIGNSKRFEITYVDEKNEKRYPVIIHTAILGGIERYIYMLLDTAALLEKEGKTPFLPTWIAPIQVRVIPVSRDHVNYAMEIARKIASFGYRVDVDDRDETLGKKIRDAGKEWIPYIVVIGEREFATNTINVRIRKTNEQKAMSVEELLKILESETHEYPKTETYLPMLLSQRPIFSYKSR
ncbi:MAG: threonine--tRNA ligase [Desulfurococcaceae archaeon]